MAAGRARHRDGGAAAPVQRLDRERLLSRVMRTGGCGQDLSTERRPGPAMVSEAVMRAGTDLRWPGWRGRRAPLAGRLWLAASGGDARRDALGADHMGARRRGLRSGSHR
ncbi:hypothetical protein ACFSDD_19385 [Salipiger marinus]|uniref:hypothetical protein n=1 Tax=Salipiger marinus TaxID=555512 RepID=UPI00363D2D28